jgi:hypothetical protein
LTCVTAGPLLLLLVPLHFSPSIALHYPSLLSSVSIIRSARHRYLLLNTAISSTWGFPQPCPDGCACDCYDCRKEECACAIPAGQSLTVSLPLSLSLMHSLKHLSGSTQWNPMVPLTSSPFQHLHRSSYFCRLLSSHLLLFFHPLLHLLLPCLSCFTTGMCSNFPASFLIDYVRVYQAVGWVLSRCLL